MIGMAILVCDGFGGQIQLRYWEVLLACALVFLFLPLECVLEAIAGSGFTLDLLLEAIIGYLNPGKPLANMAFKLYGSEAHLVAASAISSFKASHYMKIPPKILFTSWQQFVYISPASIDIFLFGGCNLLARVLPNKVVRIPGTRWSFSLNPCSFNIKEHIAMSIFVNSVGSPGFYNITIAKIFYRKEIHILPALLLVISTQFLGFGFAGLFLKVFVDSPYMWWPNVIASISLYRALHEQDKRPKGGLSRYQFFFIVCAAIFAYSIIPAYFFQSVTALSFVCWIWKDSITAQQIGSGMNGLGVGSISLDWMTVTSFLGSPLVLPSFAIFNRLIGFIAVAYIIIPFSYWSFGGQIQLRYWEVLLACALVFLFLPLECVLEAIAGLRMQTNVKKNSLNSEWNEDVSLSASSMPLNLLSLYKYIFMYVLGEKTFTSDDKMGDAELDLQPFAEVTKTDWDGLRDDTIIRFRTISQPFVEAKTA
ncbi:hypothetical protein ZIOFF_013220 [Zingiber officinale]|uniref:C2 domain-containing protein n=1 Tax=Zingiber officinale TaxID=94328 RepID=A0A8J5LPW5_ZINOF|nr:hypothetical protein ZIOFF_013220 [Zingiber officinale]